MFFLFLPIALEAVFCLDLPIFVLLLRVEASKHFYAALFFRNSKE